jgi:hypothetical protein
MTNIALAVIVSSVVLLALAVDVAAMISWLNQMRRIIK